MKKHKEFMTQAIDLARKNIESGGGPFGAIVVRNGEVIASGSNQVTLKNDPTAHAEIEAIRSASQQAGSFQLEDCIIYSSCEPCPMCLGAIYWAGIKEIYFASTREDAEQAGFSDALIYRELERSLSDRELPIYHLQTTNTGSEFQDWEKKEDKIKY